jgi:two-component system, OmpR family, sensor histidine kinase MprB
MTRRRIPAMTLRRQLVVAFGVLVFLAVALVGGISFTATAHTFSGELDRSLASAAATVAAGGTVPTDGGPGGPQRRGDEHSDGGAIVSAIQTVAADGTVGYLSGDTPTLPVSAAARALAANGRAGDARYDEVEAGGIGYRVYTLAEGSGKGAVQVARNADAAEKVLRTVALLTAGIGAGVLVLAVLAGWWLARRITRRLSALSTAAEKVALTGDLAVPVTAAGRDEVASLASSLRSMLAQLRESRDAQRRLVENAGHELRTPITSLRTNARVLRRFEELPPGTRDRLLDDVDGELKELTGLVDELVELATDRYSEELPAPTDLVDVAERVAARVHRRTGRIVRVDGDGVRIPARPHAVERAIGNLVENAVKFDPDGREPVEIVVRDGTVEVRDHGPGVPDADLPRIFDRFYRADSARSRPGSGLGLAIVRDVAEQHGGSVAARPGPDGGLVVTLDLSGRGLSELRD